MDFVEFVFVTQCTRDTNPNHLSREHIVLQAQRAVHRWAIAIVWNIPNPRKFLMLASVNLSQCLNRLVSVSAYYLLADLD